MHNWKNHSRSLKKLLMLFLAALLLSVSASCPASAQQRIMFIFDASGSMWGQIDGVAKIEIARDAFAELVQTIPDDALVGLVAYGHRVKGDCADIETIRPMAPLDRQGLVAAVNGLNPKGMTPMADSVRKVANDLRTVEEQSTIILVSDGKETCDPDPCGAVKMLKDAGIDFVMHVIGFDVGGETEMQLQCMAEAGGGQYFPAKNAAEFGKAAQEVMELTRDNLEVWATRNGKRFKAWVAVSEPGKNPAYEACKPDLPAGFALAPGTYHVTVRDEWGSGAIVDLGDVTVDTEVVTLEASFDVGVLEVWATRNGERFKAWVAVNEPGKDPSYEYSYPDRPAYYELVPGTYHVTVRDEWGSGVTVDLGDVVIGSGTVTLEASFDVGTLEVWAIRDGKPFKAWVAINEPGKDPSYEYSYPDRPATAELVPGTYHVSVRDEWGTGKTVDFGDVVIGSGTTTLKANF